MTVPPRSRARLALGLALITLSSACSSPRDSVPLGIGSYAFVSGEFSATADATLDDLAPRAAQVLQDRAADVSMRRRPGSPSGNPPPRADLRAKLPDGREVALRLTAAGERRTRVSIRIGPLGDEAESARLLERLRDPAPPEPAPPAASP